jgi:ClpP class serine protease
MGSWILLAIVIAIALLFLVPPLRRRRRDSHRRALIRRLEQERGSRVIAMIHRQETVSMLGLPFGRFIDIDDSEQLLRAIRMTPPEMPIDLILHTPGGLVLASDQIAYALKRHPGRVTVLVPHYAMSGGTLVALAADEILMDPDAVLGPVDPQLGSLPRGSWPAASILKALEQDNPNRDDETLILGDVARKAIEQVRDTVKELLAGRGPGESGRSEADAERLAALLSEGRWTHDYPIRLEAARELGLPVSKAVPELVYDLMALYPRRSQRRPSVEFIPTPYRAREGAGREKESGQ